MSQFPTFAAVYARQTSGATADDPRVVDDVYKLRAVTDDIGVYLAGLPWGAMDDAAEWRGGCDDAAKAIADLLPVASPDATKAAGFLADARMCGLLAFAAESCRERDGWIAECQSSIRRLFLAALADVRQRKRD